MDNVERLFREYHAPVVRYLARQLGDHDLADELAQETFLRALRHGPVVNERAWLFTVATNLLRDETRRAARERARLTLLHQELASDGREPDVFRLERETEDERASLRERALARAAVEALAERDRLALLMREEGLDYHEIAAALGLSVASVGTTLSRARRRLVNVCESLQIEANSTAGGTDVA